MGCAICDARGYDEIGVSTCRRGNQVRTFHYTSLDVFVKPHNPAQPSVPLRHYRGHAVTMTVGADIEGTAVTRIVTQSEWYIMPIAPVRLLSQLKRDPQITLRSLSYVNASSGLD